MLAAVDNPRPKIHGVTFRAEDKSTTKRKRCTPSTGRYLTKYANNVVGAAEVPAKLGKLDIPATEVDWREQDTRELSHNVDFAPLDCIELRRLGGNVAFELRFDDDDDTPASGRMDKPAAKPLAQRLLSSPPKEKCNKGRVRSHGNERDMKIACADKSKHVRLHTSEANNAKYRTAKDCKIAAMKGNKSQLTSSKQLSAVATINVRHCKGGDNRNGSRDFQCRNEHLSLKNSSEIGGSPLSSPSTPSKATASRDVLSHSKYIDGDDDAEQHTVTKPSDDMSSNDSFKQHVNRGKPQNSQHKASMSATDLIKLLRKFNMTLKAVPPNSDIAKSIREVTRKCKIPNSDTNYSSVVRIRPQVVDASAMKSIPSPPSNIPKNVAADCCVPPCTSVSIGTFTKWKLDDTFAKSRSVLFHNRDSGVNLNKDNYSVLTSRHGKVANRQRRRYKKLNTMRGCSENVLSKDAHCAKGSGASGVSMTLNAIPLAKAFDDLENRDRATRETLKIFTEGRAAEDKTMLGSLIPNTLLDCINSKADPLLTSVAFKNVSDEDPGDELSSRVATVIIKPEKQLFSQSDSNFNLKLYYDCWEENLLLTKDSTSYLQSNEKLASKSTTASVDEGEDRNVLCDKVSHENTSDHCGFAEDAVKLETLDADHNYHCRESYHIYSEKTGEWTPKEVFSWLSSAIQQYSLSGSISFSANNTSVRKERQNLTKTLFSHVRDADGLLSVTLDKLKHICSDDSLARYLYERVQILSSSGGKEPKEISISDMYGVGHCALSSPLPINATSMEQLEESVNIDDLLAADGVFGAMDFSDMFDSQAGSYLKYLGNDCVHASHSFRRDPGLPESFSRFSSKVRPLTSSEGEYNAIRFMQSQRHDSAGYTPPYDFHKQVFRSDCYVSHAGKLSACSQSTAMFGSHAVGVPSWSAPTTQIASTSHLYPSPMSPSSYYNLPAVGTGPSCTALGSGCSSSAQAPLVSDNIPIRKVRDTPFRFSNVIVGCRDISDNDSGIHSPEVHSPHKRHGIHPLASRKVHELSQDHYDRRGYTPSNRYDASSCEIEGNWTSNNESVICALTGQCSKRCCEQKWDCSSTSSNGTAISVESESKLLNMDDCKSVHACEFPETMKRNSNCTMYSRPASPCIESIKFDRFESRNVSNESNDSSALQRHATTVYPAFVTQIQRSISLSESGCRSPPVSQNSIPNMLQDVSIESNGEVKSTQKLARKEDRESCIEYPISGETCSQPISNRRHTSDIADSYMDSFDLKIRRTSGKSITLWEFIRDTLLDPKYCPRLIKWEDRKAGIFRFVQSDVVAGMWGDKKNNPKMTYEKLSRAMRYYYNRGILERVDGRRLVYKFGKNAHGWQQNEIDGTISPRYINHTKSIKEEPLVHFRHPKNKPRKIKPSRISISVSDDIIPPIKRRRNSGESSPAYLSINTNEQSSTDTPSVSSYDECKAEGDATGGQLRESLISTLMPLEDEKRPTQVPTTHATAAPSQPSCIVYVARHEVMPNAHDEKDIILLDNSNEPSSWSQESQETVPSKLPSANVLLGKQYKIASTVM